MRSAGGLQARGRGVEATRTLAGVRMGSRPPRVVAIGDGIVDLVTPPMEDFAPGDVQAEVPRFDPLPGGNATNFALQMSSLGASTTFIGAVGSDANAKLLRDRYREYGVRARLFVDPSRPTGSTMALTWSTGRRALVTNPGDRKSTRLNSSHGYISYAVFCLKK